MDSFSQPGKSLHGTGTNWLRLGSSGVLGGNARPDASTGERVTGADSPGGSTGLTGALTAQAASHKTRPACSKNGPTERQGNAPAITVLPERRYTHMLLILLEALGAGAILVLIVWWTMFSGRRQGERKEED
jgi:hypothetical protein